MLRAASPFMLTALALATATATTTSMAPASNATAATTTWDLTTGVLQRDGEPVSLRGLCI